MQKLDELLRRLLEASQIAKKNVDDYDDDADYHSTGKCSFGQRNYSVAVDDEMSCYYLSYFQYYCCQIFVVAVAVKIDPIVVGGEFDFHLIGPFVVVVVVVC